MHSPSRLIPSRLLIAAEPFSSALPASAVAEAIARGLTGAGAPAPDLGPLAATGEGRAEVRTQLDAIDFDQRMRAARAVVIAAAVLEEHALSGSLAFEIATRARQAGVPSYAVAGKSALDRFDARMLDLQLVIPAGDRRALIAAGRKLAQLV